MTKTEPIANRFLKYASIDTQGIESVMTCPSNENQRLLAELLQDELMEFGITQTEVDDNSFLYARIPANTDKEIPSLAFFAHMDTCPDVPGDNIKYQLISNYDGKEVVLNRGQEIILSPREFPILRKYIGVGLDYVVWAESTSEAVTLTIKTYGGPVLLIFVGYLLRVWSLKHYKKQNGEK